MIEFRIVRDVVDPYPGHGCLGVEMPSFFHDLGMPGNNILMTEETESDRWNPSILRPIHISMTEPATDLLHTCMNTVAEIDGLLGADSLFRIKVVKVKHHPKQERDEE